MRQQFEAVNVNNNNNLHRSIFNHFWFVFGAFTLERIRNCCNRNVMISIALTSPSTATTETICFSVIIFVLSLPVVALFHRQREEEEEEHSVERNRDDSIISWIFFAVVIIKYFVAVFALAVLFICLSDANTRSSERLMHQTRRQIRMRNKNEILNWNRNTNRAQCEWTWVNDSAHASERDGGTIERDAAQRT